MADELEKFKKAIPQRIKSGDLSPWQAVQVIGMKRAEIQANRIEGGNWTDPTIEGGTWTQNRVEGGSWTPNRIEGGTWTQNRVEGGNWTDPTIEGGTWSQNRVEGGTVESGGRLSAAIVPSRGGNLGRPRGGSLGQWWSENVPTPKIIVEEPIRSNNSSSALGFPERGIGKTVPTPTRPQKPTTYTEDLTPRLPLDMRGYSGNQTMTVDRWNSLEPFQRSALQQRMAQGLLALTLVDAAGRSAGQYKFDVDSNEWRPGNQDVIDNPIKTATAGAVGTAVAVGGAFGEAFGARPRSSPFDAPLGSKTPNNGTVANQKYRTVDIDWDKSTLPNKERQNVPGQFPGQARNPVPGIKPLNIPLASQERIQRLDKGMGTAGGVSQLVSQGVAFDQAVKQQKRYLDYNDYLKRKYNLTDDQLAAIERAYKPKLNYRDWDGKWKPSKHGLTPEGYDREGPLGLEDMIKAWRRRMSPKAFREMWGDRFGSPDFAGEGSPSKTPNPMMPKGGLGGGLKPFQKGLEGIAPTKPHPFDNWDGSPWRGMTPEEIENDIIDRFEPWRKPGYYPGKEDGQPPNYDPRDPAWKPAGGLPTPPSPSLDPLKSYDFKVTTKFKPAKWIQPPNWIEWRKISDDQPLQQIPRPDLNDASLPKTPYPDQVTIVTFKPGTFEMIFVKQIGSTTKALVAKELNGPYEKSVALERAFAQPATGIISKFGIAVSASSSSYIYEIDTYRVEVLDDEGNPNPYYFDNPLGFPNPEPEPEPQPEPTPKPAPAPEKLPKPDPKPDPKPKPKPSPKPSPKLNPSPKPIPRPLPNPRPKPEPEPQPEPYPDPESEPEAPPAPLPKPKPKPDPKPDPTKPPPRPAIPKKPNRTTITIETPIPDPNAPPIPDDEDPDMPCRYAQDLEQTVSLNRYDPLTKTMKPETYMVHQGMAEALQFLANEIADLKRSSHQINNVVEAETIDTRGKVVNPKREMQQANATMGLTGNITIKTLGQQTAAYAAVGQKKLDSIARFLKIKQIMDALTFVTVLHNAAMLSKSLAETLGDLTGNVMTVVGRFTGVIDDEADIDVNEILGESFNEFMKNLLGKEVWEGTKTNWKKANNVFSSASQILWTVRSMGDSAKEIAEWTAENTGKIGNSLKRYGVVGENAYPWMAENVKGQGRWEERVRRYREGVENLEDAASSLDSVTSEARNIQDEMKELKEQKEKFDKNIAEAAAIVRPDNKPNQEAATKAKAESGGKDASDDDLKKGE